MAPSDDFEALTERTLQLAIVARALDERSEQAARAVEHAAQEVSSASAHLAGVGERVGREASQAIAREAAAHARDAVAAAFGEARGMLDAHARRVHELDLAVQSSCGALARAHRRWLVIGPALLVVGCVLAVAGTAAWVASARADVARHRADAATLQALEAADVMRCGDALCARLERDGSAPQGYRRIATRPAQR